MEKRSFGYKIQPLACMEIRRASLSRGIGRRGFRLTRPMPRPQFSICERKKLSMKWKSVDMFHLPEVDRWEIWLMPSKQQRDLELSCSVSWTSSSSPCRTSLWKKLASLAISHIIVMTTANSYLHHILPFSRASTCPWASYNRQSSTLPKWEERQK